MTAIHCRRCRIWLPISNEQRLMATRKQLTTSDLVIYGIVLIQPIAPVGIFGLGNQISKGHVTTSIIIAMAAMMITALSYGRLASIYTSAGSAYSYVTAAFNPLSGYVVGWAMLLDYLVIPVIGVIYAGLTLQRLLPQVPFAIWMLVLVAGVTMLNLAGISSLSRANQVLLIVMTLVIVAFVVLACKYVLSGASGTKFSLLPLYNPATFDPRLVMRATSLAALT